MLFVRKLEPWEDRSLREIEERDGQYARAQFVLMSANGYNVPEIAERLNVDRQYIYRHHHEWPFTVRVGRKLRFSEIGLARHFSGKSSQLMRPGI